MLACFLSDVWQKIGEIKKLIKLVKDQLMLEAVLPETAAERKEDVSVQSKGKSASLHELETKQPKNIRDIFENATDVTRRRRNRRIDAFAGPKLRNAATAKICIKAKTKRNFHLLIAPGLLTLAMFTLPPGVEGNSGPDIRVWTNQSVYLPAHAKENDTVDWLLSPAQNQSKYFAIYSSGQIPRKDGCHGYQFDKNRSIIITKAQPCHAGTYVQEFKDGGSRSIVLIVNDGPMPEVTTEATELYGTMTHSETTPASNTEPGYINTVLLTVVITCCVIFAVIIIITIVRCWTGKCKRFWNKESTGGNNDVSYGQVRNAEDA